MNVLRGCVAAAAVGVLLSGCAATDGGNGVTMSSPVVEASGNPWDLPLDQRPPLFDPCTELPVASVEEALGSSVVPSKDLRNNQPGSLMSCGWKNSEALLGVLSTWKSKQEYLTDPATVVEDESADYSGRAGILLTDMSNGRDSTCRFLLFTSRGTVMISQTLITGLREYKGEHFVDGCDALRGSVTPILASVPGGDFL